MADKSVESSSSVLLKSLNDSSTSALACAVVFCVLYAIVLIPAVVMTWTHRARSRLAMPHLMIALFCAIKVADFAIRAHLHSHASTSLITAAEILASIGLIFLIETMYDLLTGSMMKAGLKKWTSFSRSAYRAPITLSMAAHVPLFIGIILQIVGVTNEYDAKTESAVNSAVTLRKAGALLYLGTISVFTAAAIVTFVVAAGNKLVNFALVTTGFLVMTPILFLVITLFVNQMRYYQISLYYPLVALTELLVVLILEIPGFERACLEWQPSPPLPSQDGDVLPNV